MTSLTISGRIWAAEHPLPTMTTFFPLRSTEWSQRALWKTSPLNSSLPGKLGMLGSLRAPAAEMRTLQVLTDVLPVRMSLILSVQRPEASDQVASTTSVSKTMFLTLKSLRTLWRSVDR